MYDVMGKLKMLEKIKSKTEDSKKKPEKEELDKEGLSMLGSGLESLSKSSPVLSPVKMQAINSTASETPEMRARKEALMRLVKKV